MHFVEEPSFNFLPLLIVFMLAFTVPILLNRFKVVPVVVGEIIAGVLVGASGLGLVQEDVILALLGDIGLSFLMFLAGMEIDFNTLFQKPQEKDKDGPTPLVNAFLAYILTLILAGIGALLLNRLGMSGNPWLMAFILSATSLGVLMPVLKEQGLTRTPFGQAIFITATLADFITVVLLTIYLIIQARGWDLEIFSIGLLFLSFFLAYRLGIRYTRIPSVRRVVEELSGATVQIKVRGAIAILLGFVVLAEFVNAELILGAFLAGMVISLIKSPQDDGLVHNLEAFGFGFFVPVFFIMVGVNLDLRSLGSSPAELLVLPVFVIISLVVKILPMIVFRHVLSLRKMLAGGILLNTHLSLEIAVAIIGVRTGLLSPATATVITLFAIMTVLVMPILFGALTPPLPAAKGRTIAICGAGSEALSVARELEAHGEEVCILDEDQSTIHQAVQAGFDGMQVNESEYANVLDPEAIKAFLALCTDDNSNLTLCRTAKAAGIPTVVAQVNDPANLPEFRSLGVQAFVPTLSQTIMLALMVRNPDVFTLLTTTTDERDVREVSLRNPRMAGRRLRDVRIPGEILVLSIRRNGQFIIPHGNIQLEYFDHLTLLGCPDELEEASAILELY